ncbi:MAG: hypothetical protein ACREQ5_29965 [Candidatus Dormibacteria bacterium]
MSAGGDRWETGLDRCPEGGDGQAASSASCPCGRRIRASAATLADGWIGCGLCGGEFTTEGAKVGAEGGGVTAALPPLDGSPEPEEISEAVCAVVQMLGLGEALAAYRIARVEGLDYHVDRLARDIVDELDRVAAWDEQRAVAAAPDPREGSS